MSRYKGRVSARAIERDFPHVVETVVPKGGLGKTLDAMHEFHKLHGIDAHTGKGRRDKNGRDTSDGVSLIRESRRSSKANSYADERFKRQTKRCQRCHHLFCGTTSAGFALFLISRFISRQVASSV
jgi:hypothetical protein